MPARLLQRLPCAATPRTDLTTRSLRFWTLTRYPNYTVVDRPATIPLKLSPSYTGKEHTAHPETAPVTNWPAALMNLDSVLPAVAFHGVPIFGDGGLLAAQLTPRNRW